MNEHTPLLRQISPSWIRNGRVTSQAFKPTPKDEGKLSVYDGDRITAEASWNHFKNTLGYESVGVVAVTVDECESQGATVVSDPLIGFREHVVIDFRDMTRSKRNRVARELSRSASERGWQYRPPS